jgi:hypothetical protein
MVISLEVNDSKNRAVLGRPKQFYHPSGSSPTMASPTCNTDLTYFFIIIPITRCGGDTGVTYGEGDDLYVNQEARIARRCPAVNSLMQAPGVYDM